MKTLSDFKKRLKVGVKLHCIHHLTFAGRDEQGVVIYKDKDLGIREVSIVQSNSFALKTDRKEPVYTLDEFNNRIESGEFISKTVDSWCSYPKASEAKIVDENTITIFEPDTRNGQAYETAPKIAVLTYKFIDL